MRNIFKLALATAAVVAAPGVANAAVTITINQVGANVVTTTSGTLSLTGLTSGATYTLTVGVRGNSGYVATGTPAGANVTGYSGFSGPTAFGTSSTVFDATSSTGMLFGYNAGSQLVFLNPAFVSGSSVAGTATFANTTIAALGLTNGTYSYRSSGDTLTVNIGGGGAVPEPATWAMMLAGFGMLGFAVRRRATVATRVRYA